VVYISAVERPGFETDGDARNKRFSALPISLTMASSLNVVTSRVFPLII